MLVGLGPIEASTGGQDITDISTAQNMSVSQLIPVILKLFEILNLL